MKPSAEHKQVIVLRKDLNMRKGQVSKVDAITGGLPLL
jgi:peptidyl-tRNA hydrolase